MTIHLVEAEHFSVPGIVRKAFHSLDDANKEAAELVNIQLNDSQYSDDNRATAEDWEAYMDQLQDWHGAQYCYVMIVTLEIH